MRFVLDCSVAAAWCFRDEASDYATSAMEAMEDGQALVPAIWPLELANILLTGERRGRISDAETAQFISLLAEYEILVDVDREDPDRALTDVLSLARRHNLTSYDASYLDLAIRRSLPIATLDEPLRKAAGAVGVGIVTF